ncbi:MAG: hypothetical protein KKF42_03900 [Actinobacteria bacterium]|nr:hypothetical protein [Actinomycetota bacterium]
MGNPLDRLDDSFPHGTVEGERGGCYGSSCPASPLTCAEVASQYRTDFRFKRLYKSGLRGQELLDAFSEKPAPAAADAPPVLPESEPEPEPESEPEPAAQPSGLATVVQEMVGSLAGGWESLTVSERDAALLGLSDEGLLPRQVGEVIGKTAGATAMMVKAARRRRDEGQATGPTGVQVPGVAEISSIPESAIPSAVLEAKAEAAIPSSREVSLAPGDVLHGARAPRVVQLWALVDEDDHLVMASTEVGPLVAELAKLVRS